MFFIFLFYIEWLFLKESQAATICDYYEKRDPLCCPGWIKNVYGDCVKSECDQDCGYGKCVGLNVCECFDKTVRTEPCPPTSQKLCPNDCSSRGQCLGGKCLCESGYSGESCNTTIISTCYVKINRGLCKSTPANLQLSKIECCEIFQVAWGNPCEFCSKSTYCQKGFMPRNGRCEDIDECQFKSMCLNGLCINENGSFRCQCPPDHTLDESTMSCQYQRDPCLVYASRCGMYGRCVTKRDGQYQCICHHPYESSEDGKHCVKNSIYNVCKRSRKLCLPHGECQPSGLSYFCNCRPGFHQSADGKSCLANSNTDYCQNADMFERCRGGKCISESNGYRCECYGEYIGYNNHQECIKREPTKQPTFQLMCSKLEFYSQCQGGECIDTNNDYYCRCTNGFYLSDDGRKCHKNAIINPITQEPDNPYCQIPEYASRCKGGQCVGDRLYGFKCLCLSGFTASSDGRSCERNSVDPCASNGHKCMQGYCRRIGYDDYQCICPEYLTRSDDGRSCLFEQRKTQASLNYCDVNGNRERCGNGICIPDQEYGFRCICGLGYKASEDGRTCYPFESMTTSVTPNYCEMNGNRERCASGYCVPDPDYGYRCICGSDFKLSDDGRSCFKIEERTTMAMPNYCEISGNKESCATGECVPDRDYGFKCICKPDHKLSADGRACLKLETVISLCGRYQLQCQGGGCMELDDQNYECQCLPGFIKAVDGRSCFQSNNGRNPVDPCSVYGNKCKNGRCQRIGFHDYQCLCPEYTIRSEDGRSCLNADQRTTRSTFSYCDVNRNRERCATGYCVSDPDYGFRCICKRDYKLSDDGRACTKIEPITTMATPNYCNVKGNRERCGNGDCVPDSTYGFRCICKPEYKTASDGRSCYKIEAVLSLCGRYQLQCQGGGCMELDETNYVCQCLAGFTKSLDGRSCTKNRIEEKPVPICEQNKHKCAPGLCYALGKDDFMCLCFHGYLLSEDKKSCHKNEITLPKCAQYRHRCQGGFCFDIHSGYLCICLDNYVATEDGRECLIRDTIALKYDVVTDAMKLAPSVQKHNTTLKYDTTTTTVTQKPILQKAKITPKNIETTDAKLTTTISISYCQMKENIEKCQPGICVDTTNDYRCDCPHSFKINGNGHECNRDSTKCPYCFYGCKDAKNKTACSCPANYDHLYESGLCIQKSNVIKHSLGSSTCNSPTANKTLVVRFNGVLNGSSDSSEEAFNSVSKLLLIKQQKSVRLNFCVPIKKRQPLQKRIQREMSPDIFSWQIVCIFDC